MEDLHGRVRKGNNNMSTNIKVNAKLSLIKK